MTTCKARKSSLRPFLSFYGAKWRDSPKNYPAPLYSTIVEPFAGSAGYSVRYAHLDVVLCEIDPVIAAVWEYLINVSPAEILAIPDVPLDGSVEDLGLTQEAKWLVGFWVGGGRPQPAKRPSKWMRKGDHPGSFWGEATRQAIAAQVDAIRHWRVFNCSYEDCPVSGPATWFVDPPYENKGKHYKFGSARLDYDSLASWCKGRMGQVIVCEQEGATWLPFRFQADMSGLRNSKRSREAVWIKSEHGGRDDM